MRLGPSFRRLLTLCAAGWLLSACHGDDSSGDEESNEPCEYVRDGECDEPEGTGLCAQGSDRADCAGDFVQCEFRNDGICDEPEGSGDCDDGSDPLDCAGSPGCPFSRDGICDEPGGTGRCDEGTDPSDCFSLPSCSFTNDGICDEPEGTGDCPEGTDGNDCNRIPTTCPLTNNLQCDEPEGTNRCPEGTDFVDCSRATPTCSFTNDGICDEPEGTGDCPEGTDTTDCTRLMCGVIACDPLTIPGFDIPGGLSLSCCTPSGRCGMNTNGGCTELNEPEPGFCPDYEISGLSTTITGCCLPTGMCGSIFRTASTDYCVEINTNAASLLAPFLPSEPIACEGLSFDGGVE